MTKRKTTAEFINQANSVHNFRYDYSKTKYLTSSQKITIICFLHGAFLQRPNDHLKKHGCVKCKHANQTITTKTFLTRCKNIHNDKYDYSNVIYSGVRFPISIICPVHGKFQQIAGNHLAGKGCSKCIRIINTTDFITKANKVHNNYYDYTDAIFNGRNKIKIKCKSHGIFCISPNRHLSGSGCPTCLVEQNAQLFINKAKYKHGNKYDYSNIKYKNKKTKVRISCNRHGLFYQSPLNHLKNKIGCPKCATDLNKITFNEFLLRANNMHGNKYQYCETQYKGYLNKMLITCKKHGAFEQIPHTHARGSGCQLCANNRVSKTSQKWLDDLNVSHKYREKSVIINGKRILADAFDPNTKTIYEYFGYFWHGHPSKFDHNKTHPISKKTYGYLYKQTMDKIYMIKRSTFNFIYVWGP